MLPKGLDFRVAGVAGSFVELIGAHRSSSNTWGGESTQPERVKSQLTCALIRLVDSPREK